VGIKGLSESQVDIHNLLSTETTEELEQIQMYLNVTQLHSEQRAY